MLVVTALACGNLEGVPPAATEADDGGTAARADGATATTEGSTPLPGSFCDQHKDALFCEDFDRGSLDAFVEESRDVGQGTASVKVEPGAGVSGTPGLRLVLTSTSNPNQNVILARDLVADAPGSRSYRLEVDVRFATHDVRYGVIAGFRFFDGQLPVVRGIGAVNPETFDVFMANPRQSQRIATFTGSWHHLTFRMEKGTTAAHDLAMTIDDGAKLPGSVDLTGTRDLTLLVGNYWGSGLVQADYVLDNVVVYAR